MTLPFTDRCVLLTGAGGSIGTAHGKGGKVYEQRYAFCLETQHFPDSPNHAGFPSTTLFPSKPFHSTTILRFSVK